MRFRLPCGQPENFLKILPWLHIGDSYLLVTSIILLFSFSSPDGLQILGSTSSTPDYGGFNEIVYNDRCGQIVRIVGL